MPLSVELKHSLVQDETVRSDIKDITEEVKAMQEQVTEETGVQINEELIA